MPEPGENLDVHVEHAVDSKYDCARNPDTPVIGADVRGLISYAVGAFVTGPEARISAYARRNTEKRTFSVARVLAMPGRKRRAAHPSRRDWRARRKAVRHRYKTMKCGYAAESPSVEQTRDRARIGSPTVGFPHEWTSPGSERSRALLPRGPLGDQH